MLWNPPSLRAAKHNTRSDIDGLRLSRLQHIVVHGKLRLAKTHRREINCDERQIAALTCVGRTARRDRWWRKVQGSGAKRALLTISNRPTARNSAVAVLRHVARYGTLRDSEAELYEFAMDARSTPVVFRRHAADELPEFTSGPLVNGDDMLGQDE